MKKYFNPYGHPGWFQSVYLNWLMHQVVVARGYRWLARLLNQSEFGE